MLNECVLKDQMVVDERSEIIKSKRKMKIDSFTNDYEKIMNEKGHCKDNGKLDGSLKAHYRRFSCALTLQWTETVIKIILTLRNASCSCKITPRTSIGFVTEN